MMHVQGFSKLVVVSCFVKRRRPAAVGDFCAGARAGVGARKQVALRKEGAIPLIATEASLLWEIDYLLLMQRVWGLPPPRHLQAVAVLDYWYDVWGIDKQGELRP